MFNLKPAQMYPRALALTLLVILAFIGGGCGSADESRDPASFAAVPAPSPMRSGNLTGQVFQTQSGPALSGDDTGVSTVGASGAVVELLDSPFQTVADGEGRFTLSGLPPGESKLKVSFEGKTGTFPVIVIPDATVSLLPTGVSASEAEQRARRVLDRIGNELRADPGGILVLGTSHPVPAGVTLTDRLRPPGAPKETVLSSARWLFFCDPSFEVGFLKQTLFILVDAETGETEVSQALSFPALNGLSIFSNITDNFFSDFRLSGPTLEPEVSSQQLEAAKPLQRQTTTRNQEQPGPKTYALIVAGENDLGTRLNAVRANDLITRAGLPPLAYLEVFYNSTEESDPAATVKQLFEDTILQAGPGDTIYLYLTAHGHNGGAILETNTGSNSYINWTDFDFSVARACQVVIVLETCFSGGASRDGTAAVFPGLDRPGRRFIICSSARWRGSPAGNSVAFPGPVPLIGFAIGGAYTQELLSNVPSSDEEPLVRLVTAHIATREEFDNFTVNAALNLFYADVVKGLRAQKPQHLLDFGQDGSCGELGPVADPPREVGFLVEPKFGLDSLDPDSELPQLAGTYTVTNTGQHRTELTVNQPIHWLEARIVSPPSESGSEVMLEPGEKATIEVSLVDGDLADVEGELMTRLDLPIINILSTDTDVVTVPQDCSFRIGEQSGSGVSVEPASLEFHHIVGTSPCPQTAGSVRLTNANSVPVDWDITLQPPLRVQGATSGKIEASSALDVVLQFDCTVEVDFVQEVQVRLTPEGMSPQIRSLIVSGQIQ